MLTVRSLFAAGLAAMLWLSTSATHAQAPSPAHERLLLELGGAGVGIVSGAAMGAAVGGMTASVSGGGHSDPWFAGYVVGIFAAIVQTAMAVPGAVWTFGRRSGRDGDIGYTLLGAWIGLAAGAAVWLAGYAADQAESDGLATGLYVTGSIIAGVGLVAGSIVGYELSLGPASNASVTVARGSVRVDF